MSFRISKPLIYTLISTQLSACMMGPDYVRPKLDVPAEFKEVKGWKQAEPAITWSAGNWWEIYNDPRLNELEEQVAKVQFFDSSGRGAIPSGYEHGATRRSATFSDRNATGQFNRFVAASGISVAPAGVRNLIGTGLAGSWQPDLWGSVRRTIESDINAAQSSAATCKL